MLRIIKFIASQPRLVLVWNYLMLFLSLYLVANYWLAQMFLYIYLVLTLIQYGFIYKLYGTKGVVGIFRYSVVLYKFLFVHGDINRLLNEVFELN